MLCDWDPKNPAFLDFESQSTCELTTAHKYSKHPSTKALTCVVKVGDTVHRMGPYLTDADKELLTKIASEHTLVAHNAPFDASIWENTLGLSEAKWCDTLPMARAAGFPGRLEDLGQLIAGEGKDKNGKRLIDMLCILKPGRPIPAVGPAHQLLLEYNVQDVLLLEKVFARVKGYGEPDVMTADRVINERGLPIDVRLAEKVVDLFHRNEIASRSEFDRVALGVNARSTKQVVEWLKRYGFEVPNINKNTFKQLLADPESYFVGDTDMDAAFEVVLEAIEIRKEIARVGSAKAEVALECVEEDGRIRDQHVYWGAHTGRWSGRAMQVHNFPAHSSVPTSIDLAPLIEDPTYEQAKAFAAEASEASGAKVAVSDILNGLLRPMVRPADGVVGGDYSAVELRVTAWVADCGVMLNILKDPARSIYSDMGRRVFNREVPKGDERYAIAKALVLGCTYGMSGAKFAITCRTRNARTEVLQEAGLDTNAAVKLFRSSYPEIPAVWTAYGDAVMSAVTLGNTYEAGKCTFYMENGDLKARLPSGRCIVYRNAHVEMLVPGYAKLWGGDFRIPTVVYDLPNKGRRGFLYGSKVCENVVQGIARDLLADAVVRLESESLRPFLHVHDEVNCEGDKLERVAILLSETPPWAEGLPHVVEAYAAPYWAKNTKKFREAKAMNGRLL